jgi:flagellar hook-basal body complex protein FliE
MSVTGIGPELSLTAPEPALAEAPQLAPAVSAPDAPDFADILKHQVLDASNLQKVATGKAEALAKGASDDLHGTMISVKEAEISMKLVGTVRNRLLDAFHELWRINL